MSANDRTSTVDASHTAQGCRLTLLSGAVAGHVIDLALRSSVTVGRGEQADVTIDDASLSRVHARFQSTPAGVVVMDLDSRNGTFVNEERVERRLLVDGDQVRLAMVDGHFTDR